MSKHIYWVTRYTGDPPEPYKAFLVTEETGNREPAVECCCWCWEYPDTPEECPCHGIGANCLTVEVGCPCENTPDSPNLYMCFESYKEGAIPECKWQNAVNEPFGEGECFVWLEYAPNQLLPPDYEEYGDIWSLGVYYHGVGITQAVYWYYGSWDCLTPLTLSCGDEEYNYCAGCDCCEATVTPGFVPTEE